MQQSCYLDIINFFRNWIRKKTFEDQLSFFICNNIPFNALLIFSASKYPLKKKKKTFKYIINWKTRLTRHNDPLNVHLMKKESKRDNSVVFCIFLPIPRVKNRSMLAHYYREPLHRLQGCILPLPDIDSHRSPPTEFIRFRECRRLISAFDLHVNTSYRLDNV